MIIIYFNYSNKIQENKKNDNYLPIDYIWKCAERSKLHILEKSPTLEGYL